MQVSSGLGSTTTKAFQLRSVLDVEFGAVKKQDPLAASAQYYLTEDHTTTWKKELSLQLFIMLVCISGAYLYLGSSAAYAKRIGHPDQAWLYVIGTCLPALATLYVATDIFFKLQASSNIPRALQGPLKYPQARSARAKENGFIGIVSGLSAVVLTSILFRFPPKDWAPWAVTTLAAIILVDNTVLHFLPVKLMLTQKIWRAPFLPFEYFGNYLYSKYKDRHLTQEEINSRTLAKVKNADHMELKTAIINRLTLAQETLMRESLKWRRIDLAWRVELPANLKNLSSSATSLLDILNYAKDPGYYFQIPPAIDRILRPSFSVIGAVWIWACASGYYAAPFNQFKTWTGSGVSAGIITALPIYILSVLLGFFGVMFVGQAYQYLTTWGDNVTKIPAEIKLAPKAFIVLMVMNAVLTGFSYGAAAELVHSQIIYDWAQPFIPFLLGCTYSGIAYVSFMSVRQFVSSMYMKFAQHIAGGETQELMKINEKIEQYKASVMNMDGDQLEAELLKNSLNDRQAILGMKEKTFTETIDHDAHYRAAQKKALQPNIWARIFCCAKKENESEPLLGPVRDGLSTN